MKNEIIEIAANTLHISTAEAQKNYKEIADVNAFYFWNPVRGGLAVIIAENGEKLAATSSISFEQHLQAFLSGKRN